MSGHAPANMGKTRFLLHACDGTDLPLYIASFDRNNNIDVLYERALRDGTIKNPVYVERFPPLPYDALTQDIANLWADKLEDFAKAARLTNKPGVFAIDDAYIAKGVLERATAGQSPILGYRPKKGDRFDRKQTGEATQRLANLIAGFTGTPLDVLTMWESRQNWGKDERGNDVPIPGSYHSTMGEQFDFIFDGEIELKMKGKDYKVVVNWCRTAQEKAGMEFPAELGWQGLKKVLMASLPAAVEEIA